MGAVTTGSLVVMVTASLLVALNVQWWQTRVVRTKWALPPDPVMLDSRALNDGIRAQLAAAVERIQSVGAHATPLGHGAEAGKHAVRPSDQTPKGAAYTLPSFTSLYRVLEKKANPDAYMYYRPSTRTAHATRVAQDLFTTLTTLQPLVEEWSTNVTYAINTVDKLKYQLDNLEPMQHALGERWNPSRLSDLPPHSVINPRHYFMIGISTVNRKHNYLLTTLKSFIGALSGSLEQQAIRIVVYNADVPPSKHTDIPLVKERFATEIQSGLLEIVERPDGDKPYPQLRDPSNLTVRWGDDQRRIAWRSKQVLDVAFLMEYAYEHAAQHQYFLMMEDDIVASPGFPTKIRDWVDKALYERTDWTMASFYNPWDDVHDMDVLPPYKFFGVIGQLFRMHELPVVVEFLRKNFDQSPLDWLFVDFLKKLNGQLIQHSPSYFQHQGKESSFEGKQQSGRSVDYDGTDGPSGD
jgi:hypothetical protein